MYGRLFRIRPDILLRIVLSIIFAFIITGLVGVDRIYYKKAAKEWVDFAMLGYPASDQLPRVTSIEMIKEADLFTIELEPGQLEPTGIYRRILGDDYYTRRMGVWVETASGKSVGQFYAAQLESGEKVLVFLDDSAISLKGSKITLPVGGMDDYINSEIHDELGQKYGLAEPEWFVDMAGYQWRSTEYGEQAAAKKGVIWLISLFGSYLLMAVVFHLMINRAMRNK